MTVVTAGQTLLCQLFGDISTPTAFGWLAYGTGTTAVAAGNTTLGTEVDRQACTVTQESILAPRDTIRFYTEFTAAGSYTVSEIGVFNASSGGTMLARQVLDNYQAVTANQKLFVMWDFTLKDGGVGTWT